MALGPPSNLAATTVSSSQINLSWTAGTEAEGYDVERDLVRIATFQPGTTFSDTGLAPNTVYQYRVRSVKYTTSGSSDAYADAYADTY